MKRIVSIFLVFLIVLNSVFFGVLYFIAKSELKKEFLSSLKISDYNLPVTIVTSDDINSNPDIVALENDEIKINGRYFDVFKTVSVNGKKTYYCISDKNEEQLEKAFNNFLFSSEKNTTSKTAQTLMKLISMSGYPASFYYNSISTRLIAYPVADNFSLLDALIKIPTPPPEV
ncbi:MAG: hypothetical protein LWX07_07265 [Bacteroidetes bacterium]|nr:hypothetical protein [Bacteroidota bacterium]